MERKNKKGKVKFCSFCKVNCSISRLLFLEKNHLQWNDLFLWKKHFLTDFHIQNLADFFGLFLSFDKMIISFMQVYGSPTIHIKVDYQYAIEKIDFHIRYQ